MLIKTHKALADAISGASVLHLNSLGKDSVLTLEWLVKFARTRRIVSLHYEFFAPHPDDRRYLDYLRRRYPSVEFITAPNPSDLANITDGIFQFPLEAIEFLEHEFYGFSMRKMNGEICDRMGLDYICLGHSKYESFARRTKFHQRGLKDGRDIFPLGMMSKAEVISLIRETGIKLHPCYKLTASTYDYPSYYKMRNAFLVNENFRQTMLSIYPLLVLDEYRYERLLNGKKDA